MTLELDGVYWCVSQMASSYKPGLVLFIIFESEDKVYLDLLEFL